MQSLELQNDFLQTSAEDYYKVIDSYNMTDKMVQERMDNIRKWYKMKPYLPADALSDDRLFRHLLAVGFSLEKAKLKIENVLTAHRYIPELLTNRDPSAGWAQRTREYARVAILPQLRREDMTRVIVIDFTEKDTADMNMLDALKFVLMVCDYRLCIDIALGEHYILDFGTTKLGHIFKMTPALIKKAVFLLQGCFGETIRGIHFVNVPPYAEFVITILKAELSKKLADRVHVYTDHESLHKFFSKSLLPKEMGGENTLTDKFTDDTMAELCQPRWRQWFVDLDKFKIDESKRLGVNGTKSNELLGIHGSFGSLDIN